jgi:hypothetical protein
LGVTLFAAAIVPAAAAGKADIQPQLNQLAEGDWIEQTQALDQLARIGDKAAVAAICQKLLEIVRKMDDREYSGK